MTGPIDTAPCGFLLVDDGAVILDANRTLADALGTAPEALRGQPLRTVLAPASRLYLQTHLFPLLRLRGQFQEVYLSMRAASGEDLPVLLNATRREEDGVNTIAVVPIARRSRFEDEIIEARREAETASESRARFLSMLSHDIRSPLTAIAYAADLLRTGAFGDVSSPQEAELERIASAGRYVLRMVTDVLDFSRLERGHVDIRPQAIDVGEAVAQALLFLAAEADAADVHLASPVGAAMEAWADPDRLQQVLLNLLGNGVKFTGEGGEVAVTWEVVEDGVAIRVQDTGPGIEPDRLEAIFAPFIQEGKSAGGVGLGLAISRELALAMGGALRAESAPGEGATFTLTLPAPPAEAA